MRHTAVKLDGDVLTVFYSNAYDRPERILAATIELTDDWADWRESESQTVIAPERDDEGADLPLVASERGWAPKRVRQLRDPCVFEEDGESYLLYSVAGEAGIAIGRFCN